MIFPRVKCLLADAWYDNVEILTTELFHASLDYITAMCSIFPLSGPLHMSPIIAVNRARFPRSRLVTLSFVKISICSHEMLGWPGYQDENFSI